MDQDRRHSSRQQIGGEVGFRRSRHGRYTVLLHDLSRDGCRIEAAERLSANDRVWLALPGLEPMLAEVSWTDEWVAGARFQRSLHPAVFDLVAKRLQPTPA